jgi:hypothetical protein
MSGRKCETCIYELSGYCPHDLACKKESWELHALFALRSSNSNLNRLKDGGSN